MTPRWRSVLALVLVLSLPLRAMAALAMPCCPAHEADGAMTMSADGGAPMQHDDAQPHRTFDCCAVAMIAAPAATTGPAPYAPPHAAAPRSAAVAAFVTGAPDRPPRRTTPLV